MSQELAINLVNEGKNIIVSGPGGVGKSWVIRKITDKDDSSLIVAPTGIAALNIGGITAHSAFGLCIGYPTVKDWSQVSKKAKAIIRGCSKIIIDEIGMISAVQLDLINKKCQLAMGNTKPFGGKQLVGFGDFHQLEPIVPQRESKYFYENYDVPFAFGAKCWNFDVVQLHVNHRNSNPAQINMLNAIRTGDKNKAVALRVIHDQAAPYVHCEDTLHLCCYKQDASIINQNWYSKLDTEERVYFGISDGNPRIKWDKEAPVAVDLSLKIGCKVVVAANCVEGSYVNGNHGTVKAFGDNYVMVELDDGAVVSVVDALWEKYRYDSGLKGLNKVVDGSFKQIPLKLGYAVTAHSAQGMTLDKIAIDVGGGTFAAGQFYMMISRIRDMRNMSFVRPVGVNNVIVSQHAKDFYAALDNNGDDLVTKEVEVVKEKEYTPDGLNLLKPKVKEPSVDVFADFDSDIPF